MKFSRLKILVFACLLLCLAGLPVQAGVPVKGSPGEIARLGEYGWIYDLKWSPDGSMLAVNALRGIVIYNVRLEQLQFLERKGVYRTRYEYPSGAIISWSPDSRFIASDEYLFSGDHAFIWDIATGTVQKRLHHDMKLPLAPLMWSHDGQYLATAAGSYPFALEHYIQVLIWSTVDERPIATHKHTDVGLELTGWTEDDVFLTTRYFDIQVYLNAKTGTFADKAAQTLLPRGTSPDGQLRAVCSADLMILRDGVMDWELQDLFAGGEIPLCNSLLWSERSNRLIVHMPLHGRSHIVTVDTRSKRRFPPIDASFINQYHMALHPAGHLLAGTDGGVLQLWVVDTGAKVAEVWFTTGMISSADWSPDSRYVVIASYQGVWIWDVATWKPVRKMDTPPEHIRKIRWSPDGQSIASVGQYHLSIHDADTGTRIRHMNLPPETSVKDMVWRSDSQQIALTAYPDNESSLMLVYDVALDDYVRAFRVVPGELMRFSQRGVLSIFHDWAIYVYNIFEPERLAHTTISTMTDFACGTSPRCYGRGGVKMAMACQGYVYVSHIPTWRTSHIRSPLLEYPHALAVRPDGRYTAVYADDAVYVYRIDDDMSLHEAGVYPMRPVHYTYPPILKWSPDGKYLMADGINGPLVILGEFPA